MSKQPGYDGSFQIFTMLFSFYIILLYTEYDYASADIQFFRLQLYGLVERKVEGDGNCQVGFPHLFFIFSL